jgi:hypothetical protein
MNLLNYICIIYVQLSREESFIAANGGIGRRLGELTEQLALAHEERRMLALTVKALRNSTGSLFLLI